MTGRQSAGRIAAALASVLALAGCGAQGAGTVDTSPGAYSPSMQGDLVGACEGNGATTQQCDCEVKLMEAAVPASQVGDTQSAGATLASDAQQLAKDKPHAFDGC